MIPHIFLVAFVQVLVKRGKGFLLQKRVVMDESTLSSARLQNSLLKPSFPGQNVTSPKTYLVRELLLSDVEMNQQNADATWYKITKDRTRFCNPYASPF